MNVQTQHSNSTLELIARNGIRIVPNVYSIDTWHPYHNIYAVIRNRMIFHIRLTESEDEMRDIYEVLIYEVLNESYENYNFINFAYSFAEAMSITFNHNPLFAS